MRDGDFGWYSAIVGISVISSGLTIMAVNYLSPRDIHQDFATIVNEQIN